MKEKTRKITKWKCQNQKKNRNRKLERKLNKGTGREGEVWENSSKKVKLTLQRFRCREFPECKFLEFAHFDHYSNQQPWNLNFVPQAYKAQLYEVCGHVPIQRFLYEKNLPTKEKLKNQNNQKHESLESLLVAKIKELCVRKRCVFSLGKKALPEKECLHNQALVEHHWDGKSIQMDWVCWGKIVLELCYDFHSLSCQDPG